MAVAPDGGRATIPDVNQVLTVCQANMQEQQVFVVREQLDTLQDYAELTAKEAAELAAKFERCTAVDGRIIIPAKVVKNIQVFCFWAREHVHSGQQLIAADFTPQALLEAKESMQLREENKQEAPAIKPDKFDLANWTEWSKHFVTYLLHTKGVQFVPLDYVVREDPPPGPLADMTPHDQALYNYSLAGCHFQEDNMMVYCLLSDLISGTTGFVWVQPFDRAQNGRAAWLALLEHYEGGGQKEKCMVAALATIKSLHYQNESVILFEDFS